MLPLMCSYQSQSRLLIVLIGIKKKICSIINFFFPSYLSHNDLTYRVVTVPLEQVHNYTFKCST